MSRSVFGWNYPPGCSGPPEDQPRRCKCGKYDEEHDLDEDEELAGCPESGCLRFELDCQADGPVVDYDQMAKDGEL